MIESSLLCRGEKGRFLVCSFALPSGIVSAVLAAQVAFDIVGQNDFLVPEFLDSKAPTFCIYKNLSDRCAHRVDLSSNTLERKKDHSSHIIVLDDPPCFIFQLMSTWSFASSDQQCGNK